MMSLLFFIDLCWPHAKSRGRTTGRESSARTRVLPALHPTRVLGLSLAVFLFAAWVLATAPALTIAAEAQSAKLNLVQVILWFDTEDYMLPADDDACKRLAHILSERQVRATFKMVGEKARVLERRGRRDVIAALKKHDIGYHTDFHSVHPTPTEYLADCGWLDGIDEFVRREERGAADVRRIFSVRTLGCYGQPGSSWAPQAIAALRTLRVAPHGVPCYVDEGDHVGLNEKPFWYAGALNVYHMGQNCTRMELHDPAALEPAEAQVSAIAERLRGAGGGLISIYYHPCEWVHRQFWDGVNFSRGANPPRERWVLPPQRTPEETDAAFRRFGQYIDYIRALQGVRFITASDLPCFYPDRARSSGASEKDLAEIASRVVAGPNRGLDYLVVGEKAYSVADQFELLAIAAGKLLAGEKLHFPLKTCGLLGPDAPGPGPGTGRTDWLAFRDTTRDVVSFLEAEKRVPSRVFIGADAIAPADFLVALATTYDAYASTGRLPLEQRVQLGANVKLLTAQHVAADSPGLYGGWVIHKEGLRAPKLLELARLQAWTLKPALLQK
jgi:hypothetical protein